MNPQHSSKIPRIPTFSNLPPLFNHRIENPATFHFNKQTRQRHPSSKTTTSSHEAKQSPSSLANSRETAAAAAAEGGQPQATRSSPRTASPGTRGGAARRRISRPRAGAGPGAGAWARSARWPSAAARAGPRGPRCSGCCSSSSTAPATCPVGNQESRVSDRLGHGYWAYIDGSFCFFLNVLYFVGVSRRIMVLSIYCSECRCERDVDIGKVWSL